MRHGAARFGDVTLSAACPNCAVDVVTTSGLRIGAPTPWEGTRAAVRLDGTVVAGDVAGGAAVPVTNATHVTVGRTLVVTLRAAAAGGGPAYAVDGDVVAVHTNATAVAVRWGREPGAARTTADGNGATFDLTFVDNCTNCSVRFSWPATVDLWGFRHAATDADLDVTHGAEEHTLGHGGGLRTGDGGNATWNWTAGWAEATYPATVRMSGGTATVRVPALAGPCLRCWVRVAAAGLPSVEVSLTAHPLPAAVAILADDPASVWAAELWAGEPHPQGGLVPSYVSPLTVAVAHHHAQLFDCVGGCVGRATSNVAVVRAATAAAAATAQLVAARGGDAARLGDGGRSAPQHALRGERK
eukprot:gene25260-10259_t